MKFIDINTKVTRPSTGHPCWPDITVFLGFNYQTAKRGDLKNARRLHKYLKPHIIELVKNFKEK